MDKRAVFLNGGGLDSLAAAAVMHSRGWQLHGLFVNYGQAAFAEEAHAAMKTGEQFCHSTRVVTLRLPFLNGSALIQGNQQPEEVEGGLDHTSLIVPQRNVIFLSLAASYAESLGIRYIVVGFDREGVAPDTNLEMIENLEYAFWCAGMPRKPRIIAPLKLYENKRQIYDLAKSLGADMSAFWSCYNGWSADTYGPCGKCSHCVDYTLELGSDYLDRG